MAGVTAPTAKVYLGDAVYAAHDGYHIVLTTEDGIRTTNTVYLEPPVWDALQRVVAAWHEQAIAEVKG